MASTPTPHRRAVWAATAAVTLAAVVQPGSVNGGYVVPPATHVTAAPYAPWAHSHFVWLDSTRSNQANVTAYVAEYAAHNISVGGLDIDSEWATGNNNFIVDTSKFPDLPGLVSAMHAANIYVILWATSMVDTDSSNFAVADNNSYLIRNGFNQTALVDWWHGTGGFVDFSNPAAAAWWQGQMDNVQYVDGFKLDGTDPYLIELLEPRGYGGVITLQDYQNYYYGGMFNYTRQRNGEHCLIWSRPVDSYPIFLNLSAFLTFSPHYVMFSGWVGDQDPDFAGLKNALINMYESAWIDVTPSGPGGYANFGSDTGGYRSGDRTAEVLIRWAQVNAFMPLFENGGNGEHRPWGYDAPGSTYYTDIYRRLVAAHYELGPYLLTTGTNAFYAGHSSIKPTASPPADFPFIVQPDMLKDYSYALGPDFFLSPISDANVSSITVTLPPSNDTWHEYWSPNITHVSGVPFVFDAPLTTNAVFVRNGAIIPLHVSTPLGTVPNAHASDAGALTLLVHTPRAGERVTTGVSMWKEVGVEAGYVYDDAAGVWNGTISATTRPILIILRGVAPSPAAAVSAVLEVDDQGVGIPTPFSRTAFTPRHPATYTPTAIAWDDMSPASAHPTPGRAEAWVRAATAASRTWSGVRGDDPAAPFVGLSEVHIRLPPLPAGALVSITGLTAASAG